MLNHSFDMTPQALIDTLNLLMDRIPPEFPCELPEPIPDYRESGAEIVIIPDAFTAVIDEDELGQACRVRLRWTIRHRSHATAFLAGVLISGLFTLLAGVGEDEQLVERVLSATLGDKPLFFSMNGTTVYHSSAGDSHSLDFFKEHTPYPC